MSSLGGKEILKNLKKKGFSDAKHKSKDHKYLEFYYNNKLVAHTKVSHGSKKDIGPHLIAQMAMQCKISKSEFIDFASCKIVLEDYVKLLKQNSHL